MKEGLKNKIIMALGLLAAAFLIVSVSSYQGAARQRQLLNQEMRARMQLEEEVLNLTSGNKSLEQKRNQLEDLLNQERAAFKATEEALNQQIEQAQEELKRASQLRPSTEEDLNP